MALIPILRNFEANEQAVTYLIEYNADLVTIQGCSS